MFLRGLVNSGKNSLRRYWGKPSSRQLQNFDKLNNIIEVKSVKNDTNTPYSSISGSSSRVDRISKPIVWIDCEMTGLDHTKDQIIEVCCIITDGNLNILDKDPVGNKCYESVIHCDKAVMDMMDEWCIEHHGASGLTKKVIDSTKTKEQVEKELLNYIKRFIPEKNVGILAGNSIHMDRLFMLKDFPKVIDHLFYRLIDVSTIMEVSQRHNPELASVIPRKEAAHTAKKDILESIRQLKWYMDHYLKAPMETAQFVEKRRKELDLGEATFNKRKLDQTDSVNGEPGSKKSKN